MEIIKTSTAAKNNYANFITIFHISKNQYVELTVSHGTEAYVIMRDNISVFQEIWGTAKFNSKLCCKESFTIAIIDFSTKTAKCDVLLTQLDKVILYNPTQIKKIKSISFTFTYNINETALDKSFVRDLLKNRQYKEVLSDWFIDDFIKTECIAKVTRDLLLLPEDSEEYPILPSTNVTLQGGIEGMNIPQSISMDKINVEFNLTEEGLDNTEKNVRRINLTIKQKKQIDNFEIERKIKRDKIREASPDFRLKVIKELTQLNLDSETFKKVLKIFFEDDIAEALISQKETM